MVPAITATLPVPRARILYHLGVILVLQENIYLEDSARTANLQIITIIIASVSQIVNQTELQIRFQETAATIV